MARTSSPCRRRGYQPLSEDSSSALNRQGVLGCGYAAQVAGDSLSGSRRSRDHLGVWWRRAKPRRASRTQSTSSRREDRDSSAIRAQVSALNCPFVRKFAIRMETRLRAHGRRRAVVYWWTVATPALACTSHLSRARRIGIDVVPTDSKGTAGSAGSLTVPLNRDSIAIGGPSPDPTPEPTPRPRPSPTIPTQSRLRTSPNPTPNPTPAPTPTPQPNRPPTVSVSGGGTCHPSCSKTFAADASDPDGDPITFAWSGACSGTGSSAAVNVTSLTSYNCTVDVKDGRGGSAAASGTAGGTNRTPSFSYDATNTFPANWSGALPVGINDDDPVTTGTCQAGNSPGALHGCTFNGSNQMMITVTLGPAGTNNVIGFTSPTGGARALPESSGFAPSDANDST